MLLPNKEEYLYSQYTFLYENYGGEFVYLGKEGEELKQEINKLQLKNHINIAFWSDLINVDIHNKFNYMGMKQIFIDHGCSPKRWFTYAPNTEIRLFILKDFLQLWAANPMEEDEYKRGGRDTEKKIKKIGYLKALQYYNNPHEIKANKNQVYICPSYWADWGEMALTFEILENISSEYKCFVSIHPGVYALYVDKLEKIFENRHNINILKTSQGKIEKLKSSEIVIGSNGTPLTEGLYMGKKIILLKGKDITWEKIKLLEIASHQFACVIDDSIKMSDKGELEGALKKAIYPPSAKKIFYKTNFNKEATMKLIDRAFSEIKE